MEGFLPGFASVRRDGRAEIGDELLKNGRGNCSYGAFLRLCVRFRAAKTEFLCGKKFLSCRKYENFLPQRNSRACGKRGKDGASGGFFLLVGGFPRAKSICPFASLFPSRADAGAASVRTASRAGRQGVAETGPVAFILRSGKLARFACLHPSPPLRPSVRFSRERF